MTLSSGRRLGPYEVQGPIGAGGMGEVYCARDTRLDRGVAVKVLPERVARDPNALARFEREARAVASLNDPNVCALFDVGAEDDVHYAVFELLEGETLRERLSHGALSPSKATELAMQVCQGLAAAHAQGIVHRDLKPENLFLTRKGLKILDFGLAKLGPPGRRDGGQELPSEEPTLSAQEQLTSPGMAPGTVAYMSPEQAGGEAADARSDIFAAGMVLYEMLSGERPFRRRTHGETLTAILTQDPPELTSPRGPIPPGLVRIIRRCLEKDPKDRFQSAQDLAFALEAVSGTSAPVQAASPAHRRWLRAGAALAVVAVTVTVGLWLTWPREPPAPLRIRPITTDPGPEWDPALSPDGDRIAYVKAHEGRTVLYVRLIDGGEPLLVSQGATDTHAPAWSPDGLQIAFIRHVESEDGEILDGVFVVPALGGAARRLATVRGHRHSVSWSPDQTTLAVADKASLEEPTAIVLLSLDSGERRMLTQPPADHEGDATPRFSPDGRQLAFVRRVAGPNTDIYIVRADGSEERRLTVGNRYTDGLAWTADGRSIVFSSWRLGGAGEYGLWRCPVSGGEPELLEFGERCTWPTVSRNGGRLAYVKEELSMDIWRAGGLAAPPDERSPRKLVSSTRMDYHPRSSPDGRQVAFSSQRSGAGEIWICDSDGSDPRQLTFLNASLSMFPSWSPDGGQVAFNSPQEGSFDVYVVSTSGGLPRRLTTSPSRDGAPSWSRDGRFVYFHSDRSGRFEVWKVALDGGETVQITTDGGMGPVESLDGRFVYFGEELDKGAPGIWRVPAEGGEAVRILDRGKWFHYSPVEGGLAYVNHDLEPPTVEFLDLETGEVSPLAELAAFRGVPGFSASPDGHWFYYAGSEAGEADIVLVENFE